MLRTQLAAAWVALQVLFFAAWAGYEEHRLAPGEGTSILVRVEPVDPRDLLRGQYMALSYEFSRNRELADGSGAPAEGQTVYAVLRPEGEFHVLTGLHPAMPRLSPGEVALAGRAVRRRIEYGVEKYFVPEGTPTPSVRDLTVRLRVDASGGALIERVYLQGRPWP